MRLILAAALVALAGCNAADTARVQTIAADAAATGQLFCQGSQLLMVAGVNVVGASAAAVAAACAAVQVVGAVAQASAPAVPVAAPAGAVAVIATVPPAVAAAVKASAAPQQALNGVR